MTAATLAHILSTIELYSNLCTYLETKSSNLSYMAKDGSSYYV